MNFSYARMQLPPNSVGLQSIAPCWLPVSWKRLFIIIVDIWKLSTTLVSSMLWLTGMWLYLLVWSEDCVHSSCVKPCCILSFGQFPSIWILCANVMEQCVPKRQRIKFRFRGISPLKRKQTTFRTWHKFWYQGCVTLLSRFFIISVADSMSHFTSYSSAIH